MALVKIFSLSGIEIEYKKDSLTLRKENNSMSSDFKVPHSTFPFLVIENETTKKALGSLDITSVNKEKIIPVVILENGIRYYGELQQIAVIANFRKCNLKYGSDVLPIINKKIAEYMPVVSVIPGETNPVPYSEKSPTIVAGSSNWPAFCNPKIGKIFPEVKFNFPTMRWRNKFGENLEPKDTYYTYATEINAFRTTDASIASLSENTIVISGIDVQVVNRNIISPQVFILSPLHYIFESINWKIKGSFVDSDFITKLCFLSDKNNNTEVDVTALRSTVLFTLGFVAVSLQFPVELFRYRVFYAVPSIGVYVIKYRVKLIEDLVYLPPYIKNSLRVSVFLPAFSVAIDEQIAFNSYANVSNQVFEGELDVNIVNINDLIQFDYYCFSGILPLEYEITFIKKDTEKVYSQMHPTINLGRYVPDWSVGAYLNNLKNQFNLDITLDNFKKEIILNLNENTDDFEVPAIITQSLINSGYDLAANSSFALKYANSEDLSLYITQNETVTYDGSPADFTNVIQSKFKFVPSNNYTSELSDALIEKEGVGLILYEPNGAPFTSINDSDGYNLKIAGQKGIYETFFRRWLKFRLNASGCEVTGYFTEIEISRIDDSKSVYINNQRFRLVDIEITEAANNFQEVKMSLLSVNY